MNKQPKEIKEAMEYLDDFDTYTPYMEAWSTIYEYIEQLEETIQDLSAELERTYNNDK